MIRDAETGDLAGLAAILGWWCRDTDWMPKLHNADQDLWFIGQLHARDVLRVTGRPALGFLARSGPEVNALYLAPEARRRGFGRALMAEAMRAEDHLYLWSFAANLPARAFYAALGFHETGRTDGRDNEECLPDIRLEWSRHGAAS